MCSHLSLSRLILIMALVVGAAASSSASSISLPPAFDRNDLLQYCVSDPQRTPFLLEAGAQALGTNNIGSIWEIGGKQPAHQFTGDSAYATMQLSQWVQISHKGWWACWGKGRQTEYAGNPDAAQLWIDLNSGGQTKSSYSPTASSTEFTASWYGAGRDFPTRIGKLTGTSSISIRHLSAGDLLSRSLTGEVQDTVFTATMRTLTADTALGTVTGSGWSVDAQARLRYADKWLGQFAAEGLLGCVSWDGLQVEDSRIISPRTFTDPEGFLHDLGGISGALWYENQTQRINPYYRMDLVRIGHPDLLLGCGWQAGMRATPNLGMAWNHSGKWMPYTRYYPSQRHFEIGAVGRGWQLRISGDDWILGSPKHAEVGLSASAIRF